MPKIDFILDGFQDRPYNKKTSSNLYKILNSISKEFDEFLIQLENVKKSHFVDTATGSDLDKIGRLLGVYRNTNTEIDEKFRGRIKSKLPGFIGGGTIQALKDVVKTFLGVEAIIIEHYRENEGHLYFHSGVLNGLMFTYENLKLTISSGIVYINGNRILVDETILDIQPNLEQYLFINNNGEFIFKDNNNVEIEVDTLLYKIVTTNSIQIVEDNRTILNPSQHYITNTATITVQIPFDFTESEISLEDTKDILKRTKAAGVALLIKIVEVFNEILKVKDEKPDFTFLMEFSGIGSANLMG